MRTIAFLLGLCLFLLTGKGSVCHTVHHAPVAHSSKYTEEKQQPEKPDIICDEVEDEDGNNSSARKYRTIDTGYSSYLYISTTANSPGSIKNRFSNHSTGKYITQRVLRI